LNFEGLLKHSLQQVFLRIFLQKKASSQQYLPYKYTHRTTASIAAYTVYKHSTVSVMMTTIQQGQIYKDFGRPPKVAMEFW